MTRKERAKFIGNILDELYPEPAIPLNFSNTFTFLIAVLLSAQCTDKKVNAISPTLFAQADTPQKMAQIPTEKIEEIIKKRQQNYEKATLTICTDNKTIWMKVINTYLSI